MLVFHANKGHSIMSLSIKHHKHPIQFTDVCVAGKQVIVCAHRYVKNETDQRWGHGQCFTLTQELKHSATWDPCQGREKNRYNTKIPLDLN